VHTSKRLRTAAAVALAATAATCLITAAEAAGPGRTVNIRQKDLISELSDTRTAGHVTFLGDGVALWTDDATSQAKAAEYFPVSGPIPTSASLEWYGTQPQPGQQIVFDADGITGNGNDYNILVGEPTYYGDNWWLTGGSSADAKAADPSGANNSGNGSEWFGTLQQWKDALPDARVYAGGFSLGSGVKGSGVIHTETYGDTTYRFTDSPAASPVVTTPADVAGTLAVHRTARRHQVVVRVDLRSDAQPAGTTMGRRLDWRITVDGGTAFTTSQQFADHARWVGHFGKHTGRHVVAVYRNDSLVRRVVVSTGR
jgi:hypothetical protein